MFQQFLYTVTLFFIRQLLLLIDLREGGMEEGRNTHLLLPLSVYSLVGGSMCPGWDQTCNLGLWGEGKG